MAASASPPSIARVREEALPRLALGLVDALLELIAYFEHARPRDGVHILFERYDLFRLARHALCR